MRNRHTVGEKVLGVLAGGTLEIHGDMRNSPSWTMLAQSVDLGATALKLTESVQWAVGDKIVLVSTDFEYRQSEVVTIDSVSGTDVTFSPAAAYHHHSATYSGVREQGEVGWLTRNVVIRGDASSDSDKFGAHMMYLNGFKKVMIEGAEVTR
jgi:cell surface hyaluronidase